MDYESARDFAKINEPKCDFDCVLKFYYDETNNIRKLYLKGNAFNAPHYGNFVLGGIVGDIEAESIDNLFESFGLQKNVKEVKFAHVAHGEFIDILGSPKLKSVFDFINTQSINMHLSSINYLYFALVDIIDSALAGMEREELYRHHHELKSVLYDVCKIDITTSFEILNRFKYPNLQLKDLDKFAYWVTKMLNKNIKMHPQGIPVIISLINGAARLKKLPFITDEDDHVILKSFDSFYLNSIQMFHKSTHLIDEEVQIMEAIEAYKQAGLVLPNERYSFADSKQFVQLQLSDIVVGFFGKLTMAINIYPTLKIVDDIKKIDKQKRECLNSFFKAYNKSLSTNPAFIHQIAPISDHLALQKIEEVAGKIQ
jgi:hypothetical protein